MITYEGQEYEILKTFEMPVSDEISLKAGEYLIAKKKVTSRRHLPPPVLLGDALCFTEDEVNPLIVIDRPPGRIKLADSQGQVSFVDEMHYQLRVYTVWRDGNKIFYPERKTNIEAEQDVINKGLVAHDATPKTTT